MRAVLRLAVMSLFCLLLVPSAPAQENGALPSRSDRQAVVRLQWPAQGTITEGFGFRRGRLHSGLDIGILRSLDVRAAASGTVITVGNALAKEGVVEIRERATRADRKVPRDGVLDAVREIAKGLAMP